MSDITNLINKGKDEPSVFENSILACNNAQDKEMNDLMELIRQEYSKYIVHSIINDTIEDIVNDDQVDLKLRSKIKDIFLSVKLEQTLSLDATLNDNKDALLLGVEKRKNTLTYTESNILQELLMKKMSENTNPHQNWIDLVQSYVELCPIQITADDNVLFEYRNKFKEEQLKHENNLLLLNEVLAEIADLRIKRLPQVLRDKLKECQLEHKINILKCTMAQEKCKIDIFTETSSSLVAYTELVNDIREQQKELQKEIDDLKELKQKYKQVAGKQYDDILKSYLQYKASLEKKKMLYNCLKGTSAK